MCEEGEELGEIRKLRGRGVKKTKREKIVANGMKRKKREKERGCKERRKVGCRNLRKKNNSMNKRREGGKI